MRKESTKSKIRKLLLANIGKVLTSRQIRDSAGTDVSEWARRVRELREDENWPILTHHDSSELRPGQYLLKENPPEKPVVFKRTMSMKLRAEVLDRNGFTCQMCGLTPGEIDPSTGRKVRLHIGHIVDKTLGGKDELSNLRALCSTCNQGAKNITTEKPTSLWLISQVRRAPRDTQLAVLKALKHTFGE